MTNAKSPAGRIKKRNNIAPYTSAVEKAAAQLRRMAMSAPEESLLGSEEELMKCLGISRPTLRQAAASVAQDRLVAVRRGVNGGYFAARPDSRAVSRLAALYLESRNADLGEAISVAQPIRIELARLAARNADRSAKAPLAE